MLRTRLTEKYSLLLTLVLINTLRPHTHTTVSEISNLCTHIHVPFELQTILHLLTYHYTCIYVSSINRSSQVKGSHQRTIHVAQNTHPCPALRRSLVGVVSIALVAGCGWGRMCHQRLSAIVTLTVQSDCRIGTAAVSSSQRNSIHK